MNSKILQYLKSQRVGVLALETSDGSPHAATVHFAHSENPLLLYFETHSESTKGKVILGKTETRASFVVGSNESDMRTMQIDGLLRQVKDTEKKEFESIYLGKFPEKKDKVQDPKILRLIFIPKWWRYTDWTGSEGKLILSSD